MSYSLNRRDFLAYGGASIAGVTLGEMGRRWLARADARAASWQPAVTSERWLASVCRECPASCGTRVRVVDGTPVKIDGNPLCPLSRGRLCAKGQAALESYFDPDRLTGPARRDGARGSGRWTRISWTEAATLVASRLEGARGGRATIVAFSGDERGPIDRTWTGFWSAAGARIARTAPASAERLAPRFSALTGAAGDPVFDLERATAVLSFGAPIVEDWLSPVWSQRSYGRFRRGSSRTRGRLVQVEGRRSLTARKADEWLPVPVERQPFLAYGIASVLLRESRVDRAKLADPGGNFAGFETAVVAAFTPDVVAAATGVPVVTLLRLARDLVATPHPLVVVAADAPADLADAVFALDAIVGAFDRTGGVLETAPRDSRSDHELTARAAIAELRANHGAAIVVFRDASALRDVAMPADPGVFDNCGLVVSFSPFLDETAAVADLLLPTHTPLESWHAVTPPTADGSGKLACARPAVAPRLDTRDLVAALRLVSDRVHASLPCPADSGAAIEAEISRLWHLRRGAPYTGTFETEWTAELERGGWWVPPAGSADEFAAHVLDAGGWVDPYFGPGQLRQSIGRHGGLTFTPPVARLESASAQSRPDVVLAALGAGDAVGSAPAALRLVTFTPAAVNLVGGPNQPVLFELLGQPDGAPWRPWAELNPETAGRLRISHGSTVRVRSSAGAIDVVALVVERTPPDTVAVSFVPSLANGGRWARFITADVRRLWGPASAPGEPLHVTVTPA